MSQFLVPAFKSETQSAVVPGNRLGVSDGMSLTHQPSVDGAIDGEIVGSAVGKIVGLPLGAKVGLNDGLLDGSLVGFNEGNRDGSKEGYIVGIAVGSTVNTHKRDVWQSPEKDKEKCRKLKSIPTTVTFTFKSTETILENVSLGNLLCTKAGFSKL